MNERQQKILNLLQAGRINLHETAELLGVTEMTLRRDLKKLSLKYPVIMVRGGAVLASFQYMPPESEKEHILRKMAIAEKLFDRIMPVETVFIGTGTTSLAFAKTVARHNKYPMTVVTNSLPVASALFRTQCRVILLGGELRNTYLDLVGSIAEKNLEEYHIDWLVTGCDGAFADAGFYTSDINLSALEKKSIAVAAHVAVITESRKFGRRALTRFASPDDVDLLVTDENLSGSDEKSLENAGIEIVKCGV